MSACYMCVICIVTWYVCMLDVYDTVCACIIIYIYIYICICVYIYIYIYIYTYMYMYMCRFVCVCVCVRAHKANKHRSPSALAGRPISGLSPRRPSRTVHGSSTAYYIIADYSIVYIVVYIIVVCILLQYSILYCSIV